MNLSDPEPKSTLSDPQEECQYQGVHNSFGILLFLAFLYQWHNLVEVSSAHEDQVSFDINGLHNEQEQAGYGKKLSRMLQDIIGDLTDEISPAHN